MSKLKVDEIRSADRSVSDSANITLADDGSTTITTVNPASKIISGIDPIIIKFKSFWLWRRSNKSFLK